MSDTKLPCSTCPWRVDQTATVIPRYNHKLACGLVKCVGEGDAFRPIMACHGSTDEARTVCLGYLAREGWSNINVRLLLAKRIIDQTPDQTLDACEAAGIELHGNYPEVLKKLARSRRKRR